MKKAVIGFIILLFLFGCGKKENNILMILWRGETECEKAFKENLPKDKYVIETFDAEQSNEKLDGFLAGTDLSKYDLVYTFGTNVTEKVKEKSTVTPILFTAVLEPVETGIIKSFSEPEENITGITHAVPLKMQAEIITEILKPKKIAALYNKNEENSVLNVSQMKKIMEGQNIQLDTEIGILDILQLKSTEKEYWNTLINEIKNQGFDLIYLPSDSYLISKSDDIVPIINENQIPSYASVKKLIDSKALIGLVSSYYEMGKIASEKAVEILNSGKPVMMNSQNIPIENMKLMIRKTEFEKFGYYIPEDYEISPVWVD